MTARPFSSISSKSRPTPGEVGPGKAHTSSLKGSIDDGAEASPNAIGLLGAQITHNAAPLGMVRSVLTSSAGQAVGVEIEGPDGRWSLLPLAAALFGPDSIEANPLTLLQLSEGDFYLQNGARRCSVASRGNCDAPPGHTRGSSTQSADSTSNVWKTTARRASTPERGATSGVHQ